MVDYKVTVFTGSLDHSTTYNDVYIKLVGTDGESHRTQLIDYKGSLAFIRGAVSSFTVSCSDSIGKLVLIELDKQRFSFFPEEDWFPDKVDIKYPEEVMYTVPIYHWITDSKYDFDGWMPNAPSSLQRPPPTKKGTTNEATMLETFPDVNTTVHGMATVWLLSKQSADFVPLGHYPKHHFSEGTPCKLIKEIQERIEEFEASVKARNGSLGVPYTYLIPTEVENSVAL